MASPTEERTPLLSIISNHSLIDELNSSNDIIPLRSRTPTLHCHVAENPFNYSARNRLVLVLILCIIFIIIEIVGRFINMNCKREKKHIYLTRWYSFEFNRGNNRCSAYAYRCWEFSYIISSIIFKPKTTNEKIFIWLYSSRFYLYSEL